ncbi:MAG: tRNA-dihydrouridine synthase [Rhodocyclaceae bacterium]|nr:tRNA-dihydrouridine synthase [Rhodocyclaceae bacterium]
MKLLLAPMEGLADAPMRDLLTAAGHYDWAVSEFARVSAAKLSARSFRRIAPELDHGSRTRAGAPVRVQLLGSDPACMAASAAELAALAPAGIDLNFGCPAPTVNRHRGGAVLLEEPELIHRITRRVRAAVPAAVPVSAKMRLGVEDPGRALDAARALAEGGVGLLVVHARTRQQGYRPPAHWEWVGRVADAVAVPVVANGEVWSVADWRRCRAISGVPDVMLGRGAVADPFLVDRIRSDRPFCADHDWPRLQRLIDAFWGDVQQRVPARHAPGRLKQWLNLLRRRYPQAGALFAALRAEASVEGVSRVLGGASGPRSALAA